MGGQPGTYTSTGTILSQPQLLLMQRLEVLRIKAHQILFALIQAQNLRGNRFQRPQHLPVVLGG